MNLKKKKNPLESVDLPHLEIIEMINKLAKESNYNLRSLQQNKSFSENIAKLMDDYIDNIQFRHLRSQQETEKEEMNEVDFEGEVELETTENKKETQNSKPIQEEESEGFDTADETEIEALTLKVESEIEIEDQKGTN